MFSREIEMTLITFIYDHKYHTVAFQITTAVTRLRARDKIICCYFKQCTKTIV